MYYTVYKTTNSINGKIYVGCHRTKNLDDGYLGSGTLLVYALEKYGRDAFEKEILYTFDTAEEMYEKEILIVNEDFIKSESNYNIRVGGWGGKPTDEIKRKISNKLLGVKKSEETKQKMRENRLGKTTSAETRKKISDAAKYRPKVNDESRQKMSQAAKSRVNNAKDTIWITNGIENKRIDKDASYPEDWVRGRSKNLPS